MFELGTGIQNAGDVNGDSIDDLVVGSIKTYRGFAAKSGKVHLLTGRTADWDQVTTIGQSEWGFHGNSTKDYLGSAIATSDFNGDGKQDLILGSGFAETTYLFWGEAL